MSDEPFTPVPPEPTIPEPTPAPAPAPAEEPPPGAFQALTGVLFAPSATFEKMGSVRWFHALTPLLVMGLLAALATFTFMKRVDMGEFTRDQLRHNRFASKMSDAQMEKAVQQAKDANPYIRSALTIPGAVVVLILVSLLYWVAFLAMGGNLTFPKSLAVVAWAQVPYWVNSILAMGMYFLKNPNEMDPTNPVLSNPAAFLDPGSIPGWLNSLLSNFDLFGIWVLILYILGFSVLGRVSKGKAAAIVLCIFVLKVLIKAAFSAVFSV
jgi:hypothetical protein